MAVDRELWHAAALLARGQVVAVATGSSYALCARALDPVAVARVLELKTEARQSPIACVAGCWEQLRLLVQGLPGWLVYGHGQLWPGAFTVILPSRPGLAPALVSASGGIGVRLAETDFLRRLCQMVGPLTATSANPAGMPAADTAELITTYYPDLPAFGVCGGAAPSTIVDATVSPLRILRHGAVKIDLVRLQKEVHHE